MVNEEFLLKIGFEKGPNQKLPNWYSIFESAPVELKCPTYVFDGEESCVTIYFSPKGPFAEVSSNDWEFDQSLYYERIASPMDVIDCLEGHLMIELSWTNENDEAHECET